MFCSDLLKLSTWNRRTGFYECAEFGSVKDNKVTHGGGWNLATPGLREFKSWSLIPGQDRVKQI